MVLDEWTAIVRSVFSQETAFVLSIAILVLGVFVSLWVWRWTISALGRLGLPEVVEGTPFERTAQGLGSSTVGILGLLVALFVYLGAVIVALNVVQLLEVRNFWTRVTGYLPSLFVAAFAIILGLIVGEKLRLVVGEKLRSVKLPEAGLLPELVKYSVFYIAALIALAQIGVRTDALLLLLGAYAFGLVFLSGLAFKDLLSSSAAGVYLLLAEPYSIGDEVRIDQKRGIVQEIDMFVTHVESDGEEYIIPNRQIFRDGIIRIRE